MVKRRQVSQEADRQRNRWNNMAKKKSVKYKTIHGGNFMDILDIAHENMIKSFELKNKKKKRW